jgi:hypothetical protein
MSIIALVAEYKARMAANEAAFQAWGKASFALADAGSRDEWEAVAVANKSRNTTSRELEAAQQALVAHIETALGRKFDSDESDTVAAVIAATVDELTSWRVSPQEAWTMLKKAPKIAGPWTVGGPNSASFNWVMKRSDISFRLDCAGRIADDTAYAPHWASDLPGLKARIDARLREDGWILVDTEEPQHELP